MTIVQRSLQATDHIHPIQLLTVGNQTQVPAPLIRITTCGLLSIEVVEEIVSTDPPLARYVPLTLEHFHGRSLGSALTILKMLLSRPKRFALKEWLIEQFSPDREEMRLDNILSQLRGFLCPAAYAQLRTRHLVTLVYGSHDSGNGYQLAAYPLIWTDLDALLWHAEQAARLERFGDDPLPSWERAYVLAQRGSYLPDERYSDWSQTRREEVAGILRQSVQALARLYLARHGAAGEEEALLLLRNYWLENLREEDVLRQLMELLGRRERYHEALDNYERLQRLLEADDCQPDAQTQDVAAYLRTKQIQRSMGTPLSSVSETRNFSSVSTSSSLFQTFESPSYSQRENPNDIMGLLQGLAGPMDQLRRALVQRILELTSAAFFPKGLSFDGETVERLYKAMSSSSVLDESTLNNLESITQNRRYSFVISEGNTWFEIFQEMQGHLRILTQLLEKFSQHSRLRVLVGETALLLGDLLFNAGANETADTYYRAALEASKDHAPLQVVILGRRALIPIYDHHPQHALPLIETAQHIAPATLSDVISAWLWAIAGEAYANLGEIQMCLQALASSEACLERGRVGDISFHFQPKIAYATFSEAKLSGYKGVCLLRCNRIEAAQDILASQLVRADAQNQTHHKSIALIDLASSFAQQASIRQACAYATQSLGYLEQTRSIRVFQRLLKLRQTLDPWENTAYVKNLDEEIQNVAFHFAKV